MFASRAIPSGPAKLIGGGGDDFLTCRMCLIPFSHINRLPLALNCLHTFCEHCISAWAQNKTKNHKLTCPMCKKVTKMERGVKPTDALPVNRAVLELAAVAGTSSFYPTPQNNCMPLVIPPQVGYMPNNQLFCVTVADPPSFVLQDSSNICQKGPSLPSNGNFIQGFLTSLQDKFVVPGEYPNLAPPVNNVSATDKGWIDSPSYGLQKPNVKSLQDNWDQIHNRYKPEPPQCQTPSYSDDLNRNLCNGGAQLIQNNCSREQPQFQQPVTPVQPSCTSSNKSESFRQSSRQQTSLSKEPGYKKVGRPTSFATANAPSLAETVVKIDHSGGFKIDDRSAPAKEFVSNVNIGAVRGARCAPTPMEHGCNAVTRGGSTPAAQLSAALGQQQPITFQVGSQASHGGGTTTAQLSQSKRDMNESNQAGMNLLAGTAITALNVYSAPAVTSVNAAMNRRNTEPVTTSEEPSCSDLCTRCFLYPAKVSVTSSKAMKAQRLCTNCHSDKKTGGGQLGGIGGEECFPASGVAQQLKKGRRSPTAKPKVDANSATNVRKKTVIKVHDEKTTSLADRFQREAAVNDANAEWFPNLESSAVPEALVISASMIKLDGPVRINANSRDNFLCQPKGGDVGRANNERNSPGPMQPQNSNIPITHETDKDYRDQQELQIDASSTRIDLSDPSGRGVRDRQRHCEVGVRSGADVFSAGNRKTEMKQAAAFPREYVVNPCTTPHPEKADQGLVPNLDGLRVSRRIPNETANAPQLESEYETRRQEAYNPQFVESNVEWNSRQAIESPPQAAVQLMPAATTKHQEATYQQGAAAQLRLPLVAAGGGWNVTNVAMEKSGPYPPEVNGGSYQPNGMYPTLRAPPTYDEIMGYAPAVGLASPATACGGPSHAMNISSTRCVGRFGKYGEVSSQPGAFRAPTRLGFTPSTSSSTSTSSAGDKVVVVDQANMTVQVFSGSSGECLSLIRVSGAGGACLLADGSLVVSTSRGVEVFNANGVSVKNVALSGVLNVVRYRTGFIAVQPRALVIFKDTLTSMGTARTLSDMSKPGQFRHPTPFQDITDVAVNSQQDLVVLDGGAIYTLTDDGFIKSVTSPAHEQCSGLKQPTAVTVDRSHNVIVSDTGNQRVLLFGANGKYQRTLYDGRDEGNAGGSPVGRPTWPIGLDVNDEDQLFVIVKGDKFAEVVVLSYIL